jgi:hypothetical protein
VARVTYEGLHGRWRTANSGERGAAWTAWNARDKKGNGALHLGVVKQTTTGRHGGADRRRRSRRRPELEDGGSGGCSSPAAVRRLGPAGKGETFWARDLRDDDAFGG